MRMDDRWGEGREGRDKPIFDKLNNCGAVEMRRVVLNSESDDGLKSGIGHALIDMNRNLPLVACTCLCTSRKKIPYRSERGLEDRQTDRATPTVSRVVNTGSRHCSQSRSRQLFFDLFRGSVRASGTNDSKYQHAPPI